MLILLNSFKIASLIILCNTFEVETRGSLLRWRMHKNETKMDAKMFKTKKD